MNNIILTGFAGTGKSTVGRLVAESLGCPFVDMDELIEERQGRTIAEIFATDGEPFFRQLEADLCYEITQWRGYVIATGGGTLVNPANLAVVSDNNLVICLDCTVKGLWLRLSRVSNRPLLNNTDRRKKKQQLVDLFRQRESAYARIPCHVETTDRQFDDIVADIVALWREATEKSVL